MQLSVEEQIKIIPHVPGVYRYYDKTGKILYIGKAKDLRKRVASYFVESRNKSARLRLLVKKIHKIEFTVVPNEKDAFLLENALIKEHQPKYNIQLKDDKSFPYIVIVNEAFPRIFVTRIRRDDGSEYFGPYISVKYVRATLEMIKSLYPIRSCALNLNPKHLAKKSYKVCLEYHLKNCLGPCEMKQSEEAYLENINHIRNILKGSVSTVKNTFKERMAKYAEEMEFEAANEVKKKINVLEQYQQKSSIVHPNLGNLHVFGFTQEKDKTYVHYFLVANGTITSSRNLILKSFLEESPEEMLAFAINEIIEEADQSIEILVKTYPAMEDSNLKFFTPERGDKKKLLDLATKNALQLKLNQRNDKPLKKNEILLTQMKEDLHLKELPFHIECFDNSNFQGSFPVASMVVFKNGKPNTKEYRHFNIKTVEGPDDFASMEEVVYRRYKRLLEEDAPLPQLILIDGGKGQLSSAYKSLERLDLTGKIQVISIAKRLEEIYYPNDELPFNLNKRSQTLKVLQHLRNEAHRFAITFHRNKRSKAAYTTELNEISGIGEATIQQLMKAFKTVKRIKSTPLEALVNVIGESRAKKVYDYFH
ncbi:MAG: excinuclease ABC subunit UvrC [Chitinophagales bacterium]